MQTTELPSSFHTPAVSASDSPSDFWKSLEPVPMLLPAVAFLAGTLVPFALGWRHPLVLTILLSLLVVAASFLYRAGRLRACLLVCLGAFCAAGWLWKGEAVRLRNEQLGQLQPLIAQGVAPEWSARLYRDPEITPERTILHLEIHSAEWKEGTYPLDVRARISVYPSENGQVEFLFGRPLYGDVLKFRAPLGRPRNFRNPGMFDHVANLERDGILLVGSLKSALMVTRIGQGSGNGLTSAAFAFRRSFRELLGREFGRLPEGADITAVLEALLFGEQSGLSPAVVKLFQETGTYHIFVVSGFNTTLIALFLTVLLRMLRVPMFATVVLCGLALLMYALMTGLEPPVVRASILSFTVLLAQAIYRRGNLLNSLALAALVSLSIWPETGRDASFLLTYLACLAILAIGIPVTRILLDPFYVSLRTLFAANTVLTRRTFIERMARRLRFETELALQWLMRREGFRGPLFRRAILSLIRLLAYAAYYLLGLLLVSLAIHLALSPLMAYFFNRANVAAFLANLFVVPALTFVLLSTLILGTALWAASWSWNLWIVVTGWTVQAVMRGLEFISGIGGWHWRVATPPQFWVWLYYGLLLAALLPLFRRLRWVAMAAALAMLPTFWWNPFPMHRSAPGRLEVYLLDVGQGESTLMISPEGRTLLVDTGGFQASFMEDANRSRGVQAPRFDVGEEVVCRFLWTLRVRSLDYIVITHPQVDHAGGLPAVLENFATGELAGPGPADRLAELLPQATRMAAARGLAWRGLKQNDRWNLGSCQVTVLSPPESLLGPFSRINDRSVVLKVANGERALLWTGDIERRVEREMIRDCQSLRADILKIAHHGSSTSTTDAFLECVQPRWALISAGGGNRFNHPSPEVLERLSARSIEFLVTSGSGALLATLSRSAVEVSPALAPANWGK